MVRKVFDISKYVFCAVVIAASIAVMPAYAADETFSYKTLETLGLPNSGAFHPGENWTVYGEYAAMIGHPVNGNNFRGSWGVRYTALGTTYKTFVFKLNSSVAAYDGWTVVFWVPSTNVSRYNFFNYFNSYSATSQFKLDADSAANLRYCEVAICPPAGTKMVKWDTSSNDVSNETDICNGSEWIWLDCTNDEIFGLGRTDQVVIDWIAIDDNSFIATDEEGEYIVPNNVAYQTQNSTVTQNALTRITARISSQIDKLNDYMQSFGGSGGGGDSFDDTDILDEITSLGSNIGSSISSQTSALQSALSSGFGAVSSAVGSGASLISGKLDGLISSLPTFGQSQWGSGTGDYVQSTTKSQFETLLKSKAPFCYFVYAQQGLTRLSTAAENKALKNNGNMYLDIPVPYAGNVRFDLNSTFMGTSVNGYTVASGLRYALNLALALVMLLGMAKFAYSVAFGGSDD